MEKVREFRFTKINTLVFLSFAVYVMIFSFFTIMKYFSFDALGTDLGIFEQAFWSTLNYGLPFYDTVEIGSHFGVHFDPILYLLLPFYAIYPSPFILLVMQSIFLGLGAFPMYLLARDEFKSEKVGLVFAILYLLYPSLQWINWYDFHVDCLMPVLLLTMFYLFKKEKYVYSFLFFVLALMCKENVFLVTVPFGIYGIWVSRSALRELISQWNVKGIILNRSLLFSFVIIIVSGFWFPLSMRVISIFKPFGFAYLSLWGALGSSFTDVIRTIITNPIYAFQVAFTFQPINLFYIYLLSGPSAPEILIIATFFSAPYQKINYLITLFGPLGLLPLLDPATLLIAAPWIFLCVLSFAPALYSAMTQHTALVISFLFISTIYGVKRLSKLIEKYSSRVYNENIKGRKILTKAARNNLKIILVLLLILSTYSYVTLSPLNQRPYVTIHDQILDSVVTIIPPYTTVATQNDIFPHFSHNLLAFAFWPDFDVDCVLVDSTSIWYYISVPKSVFVGERLPYSKIIPDLLSSGRYGLYLSINGISLLVKNYTGSPLIQI